jgi:hypothetical protein
MTRASSKSARLAQCFVSDDFYRGDGYIPIMDGTDFWIAQDPTKIFPTDCYSVGGIEIISTSETIINTPTNIRTNSGVRIEYYLYPSTTIKFGIFSNTGFSAGTYITINNTGIRIDGSGGQWYSETISVAAYSSVELILHSGLCDVYLEDELITTMNHTIGTINCFGITVNGRVAVGSYSESSTINKIDFMLVNNTPSNENAVSINEAIDGTSSTIACGTTQPIYYIVGKILNGTSYTDMFKYLSGRNTCVTLHTPNEFIAGFASPKKSPIRNKSGPRFGYNFETELIHSTGLFK